MSQVGPPQDVGAVDLGRMPSRSRSRESTTFAAPGEGSIPIHGRADAVCGVEAGGPGQNNGPQ